MALATQCPHCHTTFRVAHDQLKLRAGLVRCGACKEIFNGIENLLRPEEMPTPAVTPRGASATPLPPDHDSATPASVADERPDTAAEDATGVPPAGAPEPEPEPAAPAYSDFFEFLTPKAPDQPAGGDAATEPAVTPDPRPAENQSATPADDDPLLRMTLMDFRDRNDDAAADVSPTAAESIDQPDPIDQAIDDLQRKPHRHHVAAAEEEDRIEAPDDELEQEDGSAAADDIDEPSFVIKARRRQRFGPLLTLMMAIATIVLLLMLLAQGAYAFRQQLAARFPEAKLPLERACALIGCRVGLPMRIDALTIESNELQTVSPDGPVYVLSTLLRNRGAIVQAWPHIELSLNDANEKPLVRRVFTPREYLANPADIDKGFAAGTEQQIKLHFSLAQLKPAGYRVYIFYP